MLVQQNRQQKELYHELIEEYLITSRKNEIARLNLSFYRSCTEFLKERLQWASEESKKEVLDKFRSFCKSDEESLSDQIENLRSIHYCYDGKNYKIHIPSAML